MATLRRLEAPHPLVTIAYLAILTVWIAVALETDFIPPEMHIPASVVFVSIGIAVSRQSARRERERRAHTVTTARRRPVLDLRD